jgi:hypothetical protein
LAATDLGRAARANGAGYALPWAWRVGAERAFGGDRWLAVLEGERRSGQDRRAAAGLAVRPAQKIELLAGIAAFSSSAGEGDLRWSGGVRFHPGRLAFSYAYYAAGALGPTHHFGLAIPLGGGRSREPSPAPGRSIDSAPVPPPIARVSPHSSTVDSSRPASANPSSNPTPVGESPHPARAGFGVWGGRYHRSADAEAELRMLRKEGCPDATLVPGADGTTRVLARACATAGEAAALEKRLRKRALLVTVEPFVPESAASPQR